LVLKDVSSSNGSYCTHIFQTKIEILEREVLAANEAASMRERGRRCIGTRKRAREK
jgi:hypothetical protein